MGFRGFTCHCATAPGKTISRLDANQFCLATGLRKHYNYCITFERSSSKYLLDVLFVLEKRRYLGLFIVKTDDVKNAISTLTFALKCCYRKANELFWCSLCKEVDIFKVKVSLK